MKTKEIRTLIYTIASECKTIKEHVSNKQRNMLLKSILTTKDKNIDKIYKILFESNLKRKIDKKVKYIVFLPVPGSVTLYAIYRMASELNYKCIKNCYSKNELDKRLCYKKCNILSIETAINEVKKQMNDCWYEKNPKKCRKSHMKWLEELYESLGKARIKLNNYKTMDKF